MGINIARIVRIYQVKGLQLHIVHISEIIFYMQYNINIPLEELYEPLQQLYGQVSLYENLLKLMSQKDKDRIKKKWIIDKINEMQQKQSQQIEDKKQIDFLYDQLSLSKEQYNSLIEAGELDEEFFKAYEALQNQEDLANKLKEYDQEHTALRESLVKNITQVKSLAYSKILKVVKHQFQTLSLQQIKRLYDIMSIDEQQKQVITELIDHNYKMRSQVLLQLQEESYQGIKDFFIGLKKKCEQIQQDFEYIYQTPKKLIYEDPIVEQLQRVEKIMAQIKNFFHIYDLIKDVSEMQKIFVNQEQISIVLQKLRQQGEHHISRSLNYLTQTLLQTRFNISQQSSYQPITEHLDSAIELIQKEGQEQQQYLIKALFNPIHVLVKQKLNHNQQNRSSKIFSINTLDILSKYYYTLNLLLEEENLLQEVTTNLIKENLDDFAQQYKLNQLLNEKNKGNWRRVIVGLLQFEDTAQKKDLFFEMDFIRNPSLKQSTKIKIIEEFISKYYQPLYQEIIKQFQQQTSILNEISPEMIQKVITNHKELPKNICTLQDPDTYKIQYMNIIQ